MLLFEQRNKPFYVIIIFFVSVRASIWMLCFFIAVSCCALQYNAPEFESFQIWKIPLKLNAHTNTHAHASRYEACVLGYGCRFLSNSDNEDNVICLCIRMHICTCTNLQYAMHGVACTTRKSQDLVGIIWFLLQQYFFLRFVLNIFRFRI